jgi:hypothetical protein
MSETINVTTATKLTNLQIRYINKSDFELNFTKDTVLLNVDTGEILKVNERKPGKVLSSSLTPDQKNAILILVNTL